MEYKVTEIGEFPIDWKIVKLEEVGQIIGGGTPSTKKENYYGKEIPWITPKDLSGYSKKRISKGSRSITELGLKNSSAKLVPKNTVLLSSRAPIGYVAIAENELATNQGFKNIICQEDLINPEYLYYLLKNSKDSLEAVSSGSTFKEISGAVVKSFKIPLPPLSEQNFIVKTLSSIDEKIEVNETIIKNLKALSHTLFERWFVDFEFLNSEGKPYKSSGGEMVELNGNLVPKGWEMYKFDNLVTSVSKSINKKEMKSAIFLNTSDISNGKVLKDVYGPTIEMPGQAKKLIQKNDILYSEIRPKNKRFAYIDFDAQDYVVSLKLMVLRTNETLFSSKLMYLFLTGDKIINELQLVAENRSGTFPQITFKQLCHFNFALPEKSTFIKYYKQLEEIIDLQNHLNNEIENLIKLRETILPTILSGKIQFTDKIEVTENVSIP